MIIIFLSDFNANCIKTNRCLFLTFLSWFLPVVSSRVALLSIYGIPCKPSADCSWFLGPRCAHSPVQRKTIWLMAVTEDSANEGQPLPGGGGWGHYLTGEYTTVWNSLNLTIRRTFYTGYPRLAPFRLIRIWLCYSQFRHKVPYTMFFSIGPQPDENIVKSN